MKRLTSMSIAVTAAMVIVAAFASASASATVLCKSAPANHICPSGDKYGPGTTLEASLTSKLTIEAGFATMECSSGGMTGSLSVSEGAEVSLPLSLFTLSSCNCVEKVLKPGSMGMTWNPGTHNGSVRVSNLEIEQKCGTTRCFYGGEVNEKITLVGGNQAQIKLSNTPVPKLSGSGIACSNPELVTGNYTLTTPTPLYVEQT